MAVSDVIAPAGALPESLAAEVRALVRATLAESQPVQVESAGSDYEPIPSFPFAKADFDGLQAALLEVLGHLQCADAVLYDLESVPEQFQPASIVVHRAVKELDALHNRLDEWYVNRIHRPKIAADREKAAVAAEGGMTAEARARYRQSLGLPVASNPAEASDTTRDRMLAYLASMQITDEIRFSDDIARKHQRGRAVIERLANGASGNELPALELTAADCADVLAFMADAEPIEPSTWWNDAPTSHLCGFYMILETLEKSLRAKDSAA